MINFKNKIKTNKTAIWTILTIDSPVVAEILSLSGYDWIFIDTEHSSLSVNSAQTLIQSLKNNCSPIVRIPENNKVCIKRFLDTWCDWIIVPQVNSKEEVLNAIKYSKYPPLWERSVWISRAQEYWNNFTNYIKEANEKTSLIIQIENIKWVENIDEILSVKWIDGVFIWPYDLSWSMWLLWKVNDKKVQEKVQYIKEKCIEYFVPVWIFVATPEEAKNKIKEWYNFIACSIDSMMFLNTAKNNLEKIIQ